MNRIGERDVQTESGMCLRHLKKMEPTTPAYSKEEFARRGDQLYERLAPLLSEQEGDFVAIDIESGDYEVGRDELAIADRLLGRRKGAQVWLRRIGTPYAHRLGPRLPADEGDPILGLGENPVEDGVPDASEAHDRYLY